MMSATYTSSYPFERNQMDEVDKAQQAQIDHLQSNSRFMFVLVVINTLASLAQILECWKIWRTS